MKATEDAVEATIVADSEAIQSERLWNGIEFCETAGQGFDLELRLAPPGVVVSAAASDVQNAAVAKDFDLKSVNIGGEICKDGKLAVEALSDELAMVEPNSLKLELAPPGSSDFGDELGFTSEMLAIPTNATEVGTTSTARYEKVCSHNFVNTLLSNLQMNNFKAASGVEDDTSIAIQSKLGTPDSEVDLGFEPRGRNVSKDAGDLQSVKLESLRSHDTVDDRDMSDTSKTNLKSHQNEDSPTVFSVPKPIKKTNFVELDSRLVPEGKSRHHVSRIDTKGKGPSHMTSKREYGHISSGSFSSQNINVDNKTLPETNSLPASLKRKFSSSIKDVHRKKNVACSSETSDQKEAKDLVSSSTTGKLVSDASEPRRSSRKSQPTSRLLEGLESSFIIELLEEDTRTQHRSNSSPGSAGSMGAKGK